MFESIDKKKRLLDSARPFPQYSLKSLREAMIVEWTYNSNAIEGNTLTLSETRVVLEGITVGGKSIYEHLEAINHKEAILYIEEIVSKGEGLSEWQIRNMHQLVLKGIDDSNAGSYRKENVIIAGAEHRPPEFMLIPEQMRKLMEWYCSKGQELHPIERASVLHVDFVKIHPFVDGNGRTSRLIMNFELMKNGYPPAVIRKQDRLRYYNSLDKAHVYKKYADFIEIVKDAVDRSLNTYIETLAIEEKEI